MRGILTVHWSGDAVSAQLSDIEAGAITKSKNTFNRNSGTLQQYDNLTITVSQVFNPFASHFELHPHSNDGIYIYSYQNSTIIVCKLMMTPTLAICVCCG